MRTKFLFVFCFTLSSFAIAAHNTCAQDIHTLAKDCEKDLVKYCADITPGETRQVACLIAHNDKVSPGCRLTAYMNGKELAKNITVLERLAWICSSDIRSLCGKVVPGGGRIHSCLKKNRARLGDKCRKAIPIFETEFLQQ